MERRKIVRSGNSSFTVARPIGWIRKNKLDKGSVVATSENEVGDLVLSAEEKGKAFETPEKSIITIKTEGKELGRIYQELYNAYFRNYTSIILEGENLGKIYDAVLTSLKSFIGLDIIEQSKTHILIKNFSTFDEELSPRTLIKKLDLGIREMFELLKEFFKGGFSKDDLFELQKIEEQNKRIYSLLRKSILLAFENPVMIKTFQTNFLQLSKDKLTAIILKQLSALLESIGKAVHYLEFKQKETKEMKDLYEETIQEYNETMSAMRYKNYEEILQFLTTAQESKNKWRKHLGNIKNPLFLEPMTYLLIVKENIYQLAAEIIE